MKIEEIDSLFARLKRLSESLGVKAGRGASWDYTFPDGETHTYRIQNVRSPQDIEDDVANMCIWVWSLKDHLKELARSTNNDPQVVEEVVNHEEALAICCDLANLLKHGTPP